jgi:hypothetical protein
LDDQKHTDASAEIAWQAIQTSQDEDTCLTERDDDGEQLLSGLIELAIRLEVEIDVDEVGASK